MCLIFSDMAVYQLLYMNKTPAYAAIDESVEIAKKHIGTYSSRFVNAVLAKNKYCAKNSGFFGQFNKKHLHQTGGKTLSDVFLSQNGLQITG